MIFDSERLGYNVDNEGLTPNTSNSEYTTDYLDILSNGFNLKHNDLTGYDLVGYAVAESPLKYANAR